MLRDNDQMKMPLSPYQGLYEKRTFEMVEMPNEKQRSFFNIKTVQLKRTA